MAFQTINPATGALIETFPTISGGDLHRALSVAHTAFETD